MKPFPGYRQGFDREAGGSLSVLPTGHPQGVPPGQQLVGGLVIEVQRLQVQVDHHYTGIGELEVDGGWLDGG